MKASLLACLLLMNILLLGNAALAQETPSPSPQATATPIETPSPSESPAATPAPTETETPSPTPPARPLAANPASVQSNIGVPQTVTIGGAGGALTATIDPRIAGVTVSGSTVTIAPIVNGRATIHVSDAAGGGVDIPLRIAPNAATIAKQITLKLTGDSVDPTFVAAQTALALRQATNANPGTTVNIAQVPAPANPLGAGGQLDLSIPVSVLGGDQYLDVSDTTHVIVQNVPAQPFAPTVLYYSDDPERIVSDGVLFRGTVGQSNPVRLYDYHENGTDSRRLIVALTGASTSPTTVQMVESFAGPNIDVMSVGHAVTRNFLIQKPRNEGVIVDLPDGAPLFMRDVAMGFRQGVADVADFRVVSGGAVTITVLAVSPGVAPATLLGGPQLSGDGKGRSGTFSLASYGTQTIDYTVGGQDASTTIGDREPSVPKADPAIPGADFGDYGVMFNLTLTAHNPGDTSQTVYIYEAPRGGPVRASYLLDNQSVPTELGCGTSPPTATSAPHRYLIGQFDVGPRSTQTHLVRTMTDGGSNYPLEIGLTSQPPQPATPPISALDGCFPKPQPNATPPVTP